VISPEYVLTEVRAVLRDEVLPHVEDPRARTSLVAALGILGDLALQVTEDDEWCAESADVLGAALHRWGPDGVEAQRRPGESAVVHRRRLLTAAGELVPHLGGEPLRGVRSALAHDLTLQQRRTRSTGGP
jgi:hypothetical protein